ncbi:SDR family NAD(P)-dependent oxidoreductase [Corynebacterium mendelii]|uniref:SDR family NAD(P)-dependent oxidoreductase n=1 Tax=Corynebacterium mendelii TaxID=2765362 RepID=A0A939E010_9CORY|nr:SDR family NAD(P)-dependent oxidoreductase [Corynebacterium mendelii]MBN9644410.1 SDR family NAD(P)-dependent oxidoreductase [Corynebacterium mendelii]
MAYSVGVARGTGNGRRTIVVTGASSGIGLAATEKLLAEGHRVISVGRNPEKISGLAARLGNEWFVCDFADFADVARLARDIAAATDHIDVLANNAGAYFSARERTVDGHEKTLQVNHLSPSLLTLKLLPCLQRGLGYVVMTSSVAGKAFSSLDVTDIERTRRSYRPMEAYADSKLMNAIFARELSRRFAAHGIFAVSFHPGVVASSFATTSDGLVGRAYRSRLFRSWLLHPERAAERLTALANGTVGVDFVPGGYYSNNQPVRTHELAYDDGITAAVWNTTLELINDSGDFGIDESMEDVAAA